MSNILSLISLGSNSGLSIFTSFTFLSKNDINLKEVINTNNCHLKIEFHENIIHITTVLDNLLKGASGQAVQNLNIIYGYKESLGLNFKGSIY